MKKKSLIVIGIIVAIGVITGVSYALWKTVLAQSGENIVKSSCFDITFEETEGIYLKNSFPIYDAEGKKLKPYKVTITNHCSNEVDYQVNFETTNNTTMKDSYIKLMVNESNPVLLNSLEETSTTISNGKSAYIIENGSMEGNSSKAYNIRIWMDERVTQNDEGAMNGTFEGKVTVVASYITQYREKILHGTDPVLKDGLIPVTISDDGTVYRANIAEEWYSYANQEWANAVILEDESIEYGYNEEIPEENIESYFVWIPRYKYKLFNLGEYPKITSINESVVQVIEVVFGTDTTDDANEGECTTPMISGETGNCKVGDYMSHPAFLSFEVNGIWVGKFETGYKGATSTSGARKNENNPDKVQIKPNVYSWGSISVANIHLNAYNYKREYDSHMMKNTEWGAVAYLQYSMYGSHVRIWLNNNSNYITGYAAAKEPTTGSGGNTVTQGTSLGIDGTKTYNYKNPLSVVASTTNNYTGVYDVSGGRRDYVAGVMASIDSTPFPEEKYYDEYVSNTGYNLRILGDATGEMGPFGMANYGGDSFAINSWGRNESYWISKSNYFQRGGVYGNGISAGMFAAIRAGSGGDGYSGFRIVLAF